MADNNENSRNEPDNSHAPNPVSTILAWIIMLAVFAGICYLIWIIGGWVFDYVGNIFGGDVFRSSDLERYCAGKYRGGGAVYQQCIDGGWKDWYANAHWMK